MPYTPSQKILEKYADVLVNFALNHGKGIKKGDVVRVSVNECAKPMYVELRRAIMKAGGHVIAQYITDDDKKYNISKEFYTLSSDEQLSFFPAKYYRGMVDTVDHSIAIMSETNLRALKGVDPKKMMMRREALKLYTDWLREKENAGKYTWTGAIYGTLAMAKEAGLSEKEYWNQIIKACFLDKKDSVAEWRKTAQEIRNIADKLTKLQIDKVHVVGPDVDLWVKIGEKRRWKEGVGPNIPSFEIFTSPDWRGTEGWIKFNQPLYHYGDVIEGIELEFKNGVVVKSKARKREKLLKEMIATEGSDKIGEFSLTDGRFSRITKFMADSLFDENVGGPNGNTHIALGNSYHDCCQGDIKKTSKKEWARLGFNHSVLHTDIVSTAPRTVMAYLPNGKEKIIYEKGKFVL